MLNIAATIIVAYFVINALALVYFWIKGRE